MSDREKVLLLKDLFEDYKHMLNLTQAEEHEIEMWLEYELGGVDILDGDNCEIAEVATE